MKKVLFELLYTLASNYQFGNPSGQIGVPNALALCRWQLRKVVRFHVRLLCVAHTCEHREIPA